MQTENVNSHMRTCLPFLSRHIGIFCLKNEDIFIFLPIKLFFISTIPHGEILPPFCKLPLANLSQKENLLHVISYKRSFGPSDWSRTCGILLPKQARYHLRYTRIFKLSRQYNVLTFN